MKKLSFISNLKYFVIAILIFACFSINFPLQSLNFVSAAVPPPTQPASAVLYGETGTHYEQISVWGNLSVVENSSFTLRFAGSSMNAVQDTSTYTLSLYSSDGATKLAFPANSSFQLIDYSSTGSGKSAIYRFGIDNSQEDINLEDFTYLGSEFHVSAGSGTATEDFQIIFSTPLAVGSYKLIIERFDNGASVVSAEINLTVTAQQTTFALSASKTHDTVYTDSTERIALNITPSNSTDATIRQKGRGIRVSLEGETALPNLTKFQLYEGEVKIGDDWELEKSYAFNTNSSSTVYLDLTIPSNAIADGTYSLKIELFTEDGEVLASTTLSLPIININYKVNVSTLINNGSGLNKNLVYTINASTSVAFGIVEELPDDATVKFDLEKRNASGDYDLVGTQTTATATEFRAMLSGTTDKVYNLTETITKEGVYRFRIEVYDRNDELKCISYSYLVGAISSSSSVNAG